MPKYRTIFILYKEVSIMLSNPGGERDTFQKRPEDPGDLTSQHALECINFGLKPNTSPFELECRRHGLNPQQATVNDLKNRGSQLYN